MRRAAVWGLLVCGALLAVTSRRVPRRADAPASEARLPTIARVTRTEQAATTIALPESTVRTLGGALAAHLHRSSAAELAISEARAGQIDPVELGQRLRAATAGHAELGYGLLHELLNERSPSLAMPMAQALADLQDDDRLRQDTVEALRAGSAQARSVGLLALMGRGEPEAVQLAADSFAGDSPAARGTAGFLLNNLPDGLNDQNAEPVLAAARTALSDGNSGDRAREEAATLLGRKEATPADVSLLESLIFQGDASVRTRALAALVETAIDGARLHATIARAASDPNAPAPLVEMANAWLAQHSA